MRRHAYVIFVLTLTLSASLIPVFIPGSLPTVPLAHAVSKTISLVGIVAAWNNSRPSGPNPTITVNQGDIVTIKLTAGDTSPHMFALDVDKDGTVFSGSCTTGDQCSALFTGSTPTSVMIDTSSLSGMYTYFCTIHSTMVGSFIVVGGTIGASSVPMNSPAMITIYLIIAGLAAMIITSAVVLRTRRTNTGSTQ